MRSVTPTSSKVALGALVLVALAVITGCSDGVLVFPEPNPASVRIVNVTSDVDPLGLVLEGAKTTTIQRGAVSEPLTATAGRPISFVFKDGDSLLRRDTLFYTLGGSASVILFAKGTKTNLVEFRQAIQDTNAVGSSVALLRFTHMSDYFDKAEFVELYFDTGEKVFDNLFQPGISSTTYKSLPPGTYSFVLRELGTELVLARLSNVQLAAGSSYMLYTYDAAPPAVDSLAMSVFH